MKSDSVKKGIERAPHRSLFYAMGLTPKDMDKPIKGFGLGLNYVKYVCKAHSWDIKLDSSVGNGCKFTIYPM